MQSSNKPQILFVDDEEMTRKTFERIAGKEFEVLTADSVASAKTLLDMHADEIGVLLSDQRMPGQLGVELLEYCREAYPSIVRMLTTAYSDLADAIAAVNRGEIIRYIEKPWNNIDSLLIDLRVAMRFHMLERENTRLLEEKLSVGAVISRLDRVRSLIGIASAQTAKKQRLHAVEKMLRDLSHLECIQNSIDAKSQVELEMFGQPVSDTKAAIDVAEAYGIYSEARAGESWNDVLSVLEKSGCQITVNSGATPAVEQANNLAAMAYGGLAALSSGGGELTASVNDFESNGWQLLLEHRGEGCSHVADWLSGLSIEEANLAIAGLLQLYISAIELGAKVELSIAGNAIKSIEISMSDAGEQDVTDRALGADWIDDILLIYS